MRITALYFLLFALVTSPEKVFSQEEEKMTQVLEPEVSTTRHSAQINGQTINYTAKAGTMKLRDENNKPIALFGFTSYTKDNTSSNRPIVFSYNGGPGSSSYWLHMGVMGPKRVVVNDPTSTPAAPYRIENNEYSILDIADIADRNRIECTNWRGQV